MIEYLSNPALSQALIWSMPDSYRTFFFAKRNAQPFQQHPKPAVTGSEVLALYPHRHLSRYITLMLHTYDYIRNCKLKISLIITVYYKHV